MAQELDIIPKSENFINPYKQSNQKKKVVYNSVIHKNYYKYILYI